MPSLLTYSREKSELSQIRSVMRDDIAWRFEEEWDCRGLDDLDEFLKTVTKLRSEIVCYDVTNKGAISKLSETRQDFDNSQLVIISDNTVSPMEYMKPSIHPASLFMRPLDERMIRRGILEILETIDKDDGSGKFIIKTRSGNEVLRYRDISCFEARERRIFVRCGRRELHFYDTLDNLAKRLPDTFLRCHKSFIINTAKIECVNLPKNTVVLTGELDIPVSRTYKPAIKEFMAK
ncbi:MAG TPA: LytTR family transcriptional regulator [Candidatus Monoglobus merdigallinarum]|uniref:LytTR family transcriptional regulator n=1 Tax=Candidatus Monoglobus merdigallinarum TaxID=2838698 RepID=A0A9D1TL29_9FIRM|nr:LytTR family transcriptional regulator [Candidatus Monoglobus merdigallinarum]